MSQHELPIGPPGGPHMNKASKARRRVGKSLSVSMLAAAQLTTIPNFKGCICYEESNFNHARYLLETVYQCVKSLSIESESIEYTDKKLTLKIRHDDVRIFEIIKQ